MRRTPVLIALVVASVVQAGVAFAAGALKGQVLGAGAPIAVAY